MKISDYLNQEEIKHFTAKSDAEGWKVLLINWGSIFAILAVVYVMPNIVTIFLAVLLIGGRQLGLAILMHECCHKTLFKTPELNQRVGNWLCAMPTLVTLPAYTQGHLKHHQLAGTENDPDLKNYQSYPVSKESFRRKIMRDIKGQTGIKLVKLLAMGVQNAFSNEVPKGDNPFVQLLLTQLAIFFVFSLIFSPWIYLIWVAAFLTSFMLVVRLRQVAEHANVPDLYDLDPRKNTRTTIPRIWERCMFAPNAVNYHLEHHFMASVPCYRLKALHHHLRVKGAYENTKIFYGYPSVFRHAVI